MAENRSDSGTDDEGDVNPFRKQNKKDEQENSARVERFLMYKLMKQTILVAMWITMGLMIGVAGPTLPDLKALLGVNYEEIARAYTGTSIGALIGGIIGGMVHERFYRFTDLFSGVCTVVAGIGLILVPWMRGILPLFCLLMILGVTLGMTNAGGNAMVLHLWGKSSGPPMFALHFGFGFGGMLGPQIARPFISEHSNTKINQNETMDTRVVMVTNDTLSPSDNPEDYPAIQTHDHSQTLFIPFLIIGIVTLIVGIAMLVMFKIGPPEGFPKRKSAKKVKELFSLKRCAAHAPCYGILILSLLFFYFAAIVGGESIYPKFIFAFTVESDLDISESGATFLTSLFWLGHLTGRALSTVMSRFTPISIFIAIDIGLLLVVTVILAITAHPTVLWIFTPVFGLLVSPLYPGGMLWSNKYLKANSMTIMVCLAGTGLGALAYVYCTGYMFEYVGPQSLMYIEMFNSAMLVLIFGAMEFMGRKYLQKVKEQVNKADDNAEELQEKLSGKKNTSSKEKMPA